MLTESRNGAQRATPIPTSRAPEQVTRRLLTAEDVWVKLRMERSTFYKRRASGWIPDPIMYNGDRPLWLEAEIDHWIDSAAPHRDKWIVIRTQFKDLPPKAA